MLDNLELKQYLNLLSQAHIFSNDTAFNKVMAELLEKIDEPTIVEEIEQAREERIDRLSTYPRMSVNDTVEFRYDSGEGMYLDPITGKEKPLPVLTEQQRTMFNSFKALVSSDDAKAAEKRFLSRWSNSLVGAGRDLGAQEID